MPAISDPPSELCILRLSAIGDCCHTVPVVRALQAAWPETKITWIVGKVEHGLLRGLEGVEFLTLDKSRGLRGFADLRRGLRGRRFPLLLHMHASMRANAASLLVDAPDRLGFDRARARDFQWWFCSRRVAARPSCHVMDGLFGFAEAFGIERGAPRWDIPVEDEDREAAAALAEPGRPVLVISPCTGQRFRNYRNWRIERYAEVADYAAARYGAQVLLTGGKTAIESDYGRGIADLASSRPKNLVGETSLKRLLAILERATVVLCPDSGPAHMATAVRTPVVGLYATSNRVRTGPYFSQHLVVDKYPEAVLAEFGKSVDEIAFGRRVRDPNAMDRIRVEDVVEKLDLAFAERGVSAVR
ncbi:MAG TPA: glycosyltransferase family 9 protein [Gammaproteobacteria bacterium]|nr:glycosyltransferase family 9 protein [Gammaproteobacteria bacterium]